MSYSKKNVQAQTLNDLPEPTEDQEIVQVIELRGGPHCLVRLTNGTDVLCLIPTKFRNVIWIKRGNYSIVRKPKLDVKVVKGTKVQAIVDFVLFEDHIKHLKKQGLWPESFENQIKDEKDEKEQQQIQFNQPDDDLDSDEDPFFQNLNRKQVYVDESSEDDE